MSNPQVAVGARPHGSVHRGSLWIWVLLKSGREQQGLIPNDLLRYKPGEDLTMFRYPTPKEERTRKVITIPVEQIDAVVVLGVIGRLQ